VTLVPRQRARRQGRGKTSAAQITHHAHAAISPCRSRPPAAGLAGRSGPDRAWTSPFRSGGRSPRRSTGGQSLNLSELHDLAEPRGKILDRLPHLLDRHVAISTCSGRGEGRGGGSSPCPAANHSSLPRHPRQEANAHSPSQSTDTFFMIVNIQTLKLSWRLYDPKARNAAECLLEEVLAGGRSRERRRA